MPAADSAIRTPLHPAWLFIRTMHPALFLPASIQLTVTVFLAIVPFISATPSQPFRRGLHSRDPVVQQRNLPGSWKDLLCFTDSLSSPSLTGISYSDSTGMTVEACIKSCNDNSKAFAGLKNGTDCHCGNFPTATAVTTSSSACNTPCVGNYSETCGGSDSLSLYWNGHVVQPLPVFVQSFGASNLLGCFTDSNDARTLTVQVSVTGGQYNNSVESCVPTCNAAGYSIAGVEFAEECWCDNKINNQGRIIDDSSCILPCSGNSLEFCGGANRLLIYSATKIN